MGLPIWIYDYKAKRYVVFQFHLLETFPDGRRGLSRARMTLNRGMLLSKFHYLFETDHSLVKAGINIGGRNLMYDETRYLLKERWPTKDPKTGAKWYSKENSQIKKYKRKR